MPKRSSKSVAPTREAIEELFLHPPINDGDLQRRLSRVDAAEAQQLLVARLASGGVREADGWLFRAALRSVGIGAERDRLLEIALDGRLSTSQRGHALAVLDALAPGAVEDIAHRLSPEELLGLSDIQMLDLLVDILGVPDDAAQLRDLFLEIPTELRPTFLERFESCRRRIGTPAALVYPALLDPAFEPALRLQILDTLLEEGGESVVELLDQLQRTTPHTEHRRALMHALLRARTALIERREGDARGPAGMAYLGSCDGAGAYGLFGCFASIDDTYTCVDLCILTTGTLGGVGILPRMTKAEIDAAVAERKLRTGTVFVPTTLARIAHLVVDADGRNELMGDELRVALALFHQVVPERLHRDFGTPAAPSPRQIEAVLAAPEYESWFFEEGDLGEAGLPPRRKEAFKRWVAQATGVVAEQPELRERVIAMVRHMALWHHLQGDAEQATLFEQAAQECQTCFSKSALLTVLLKRCQLRSESAAQAEVADTLGDRAVREHLKLLYFHTIERPRGRDLAHLDFSEAALALLEGAMTMLSSERRPRHEALLTAAHQIGQRMADYFIASRRTSTRQLVGDMAGILSRTSRLRPDECQTLVTGVLLPGLTDFFEHVCGRCPVQCFEAPRRIMADAFFGPHHPALRPE